MKKILIGWMISIILTTPCAALGQGPDMSPRKETPEERGERMAQEVRMAEEMRKAEAERKAAEEKYKKEQEEQFRRSAAALEKLWKEYRIEAKENQVKAQAQLEVDAADYRRKNIIVGPILKFFDLFKGPQWADKLRQQEAARERARIKAEEMKEEKMVNKALRKADEAKMTEAEKRAAEDAKRRKALQEALEAARKAEQLRKIQEDINRINRETKAMKEAQEETRKNINRGLEKLGGDKKPKSLP